MLGLHEGNTGSKSAEQRLLQQVLDLLFQVPNSALQKAGVSPRYDQKGEAEEDYQGRGADLQLINAPRLDTRLDGHHLQT